MLVYLFVFGGSFVVASKSVCCVVLFCVVLLSFLLACVVHVCFACVFVVSFFLSLLFYIVFVLWIRCRRFGSFVWFCCFFFCFLFLCMFIVVDVCCSFVVFRSLFVCSI